MCAGRAIPHRLLEVNLMIHDAARLITGETLYIGGGYHIIERAPD
jgi:enoyl-[acyl-carrier-protein] reductase (NADH)